MTISIKELTNHSYVDHQLSATLDSTEAFEGPEKLLEIWFYPQPNEIPTNDKGEKLTLRSIPVEKWVSILNLVKCEILSIKSTPLMDAFLLSESSLFVYDHRLTLKTCGTTTTLFCLPYLFEVVKNDLGWDFRNLGEDKMSPFKVFYSRRAFMFPSKQKSIHKNWADEVEYLNKFFCNGKAYVVGRYDERKHWNLYVTDTRTDIGPISADDDETLEILMTGLNHDCADQFVSNRIVNNEQKITDKKPEDDADDEGHLLGYNMTKKTGLDNIYLNDSKSAFHHDAFAFSPCGYSSNMILDNQYYYTLHITPEKGWSYASFESNVPVSKISHDKQDNVDVLMKVLDVFKPDEFCLTFFSKTESNINLQKLLAISKLIPHYKKKDKIVYDLEDYQLLFIRFEHKND
ncbi:S-adenosylmethionine decarboxylase proenzyme [Monosporozyma unispora]|nr:spermidine resistance protein [Kazachstania unispora]